MVCTASSPCLHTVIRRAWLAVLLFAWLGWPAAARADTTQSCTGITTLPAALFVPGRFCLHKDFSAASYSGGRAIYLGHDDIILDCNGHTIANTNPTTLDNGIEIQEDNGRVTIRNCVIDGFLVGIKAEGLDLQAATRIRIEDNTVRRPRVFGIQVIGGDVHIVRNRISGVTGNFDGTAEGIRALSNEGDGVGMVVRDNHVSDIRPAITGRDIVGINVYSVSEPVVTGNTVSGVYSQSGWDAYGIDMTDVAGAMVSNNIVLSPPPLASPLDGDQYHGIRVVPRSGAEGTNVCRDNVVGHFLNNVGGCALSGNTTF